LLKENAMSVSRSERVKRKEQKLQSLLDEMNRNLPESLEARCERHSNRSGVWQDLHPFVVVTSYHRQKGQCFYCRRDLNYYFHIEHMKPVSRGGDNNRENIVVSCGGCNLEKGTRKPQEWTPLLRKPRQKVVILRKKDGKETRIVDPHKASQKWPPTYKLADLYPDSDELSGYTK
jgi:5-methylcytosine-specific restriction endonuclease McrA